MSRRMAEENRWYARKVRQSRHHFEMMVTVNYVGSDAERVELVCGRHASGSKFGGDLTENVAVGDGQVPSLEQSDS